MFKRDLTALRTSSSEISASLSTCSSLSSKTSSGSLPESAYNSMSPKKMAKVCAASLPDGSIIPYSSSVTDKTSSGISYAEVPPNKGRHEVARVRTFTESGSSAYVINSSDTTLKVIIFVKDATCLVSFSRLAKRSSPVSMFVTHQDRAETNGAGLSRLKNFVIAFE